MYSTDDMLLNLYELQLCWMRIKSIFSVDVRMVHHVKKYAFNKTSYNFKSTTVPLTLDNAGISHPNNRIEPL